MDANLTETGIAPKKSSEGNFSIVIGVFSALIFVAALSCFSDYLFPSDVSITVRNFQVNDDNLQVQLDYKNRLPYRIGVKFQLRSMHYSRLSKYGPSYPITMAGPVSIERILDPSSTCMETITINDPKALNWANVWVTDLSVVRK
jgi:hypothetical protein